jgi:beta-lactamase regulating signal transducer with metallopeptidase domain
MSEFIQTLNRCGEVFAQFASPMLWQSSLLIAIVFAVDVLMRRIRASVRYALWMVILIKLILPPSLALPTGATWWLWRPHPAVVTPVIQNYTVSFGNATAPDVFPTPTVPIVLPPPTLSIDAWVLLAAVATAAGLFLWLMLRWLRVARKVRRAATASAELQGILDEARQLAGLRRHPRLKLIEEAQSPAVYGLLRPIILLPQALAGKLSPRQLRGVLVHELVHLRRGDVWMNCAQTVLQIVYWWHPLLWLANARIRRLREEAVDDAVMLALRDGADAYAPTLLEVAKFAFRRPLASLGLVGILESRSALRQRVERLVHFRPPRKAGITFLSLCGIFAFCAVALPMGQGPAAGMSTGSPGGNPIGPQVSSSINAGGSNAVLAREASFSERAESGLAQALAEERKEAHQALVVQASAPPQFHIKARFIEVPRKFFSSAATNSLPSDMTNGEILTATETKDVLRLLESQKGAEELAEPEVTTISGRETEMRATITRSIVTNLTIEASGGAIVPQTTQVETGSIFDVVPCLLADGYTINLTAIAAQIDFLGYRTSNGLVPNITTNSFGSGVSPIFQTREAWMNKDLRDGQTLVLFPRAEAGWSHVRGEKGKKLVFAKVHVPGREGPEHAEEKKGDKVLIVLTTATLIDAAGNRVHAGKDLPFWPTYQPIPTVTNWAGF